MINPLRAVVPDTLFSRLFAAIAAVIALTLLIILWLIVRERQELAFMGSIAGASATSIAQTSEYLAELPRQRRAIAREELQQDQIVLDDLPPRRRAQRNYDPRALERMFAAQLQKQLGDRYRVTAGPARDNADEVIEIQPLRRRATDDGNSGRRRLRLIDVRVVLPDGEEIVFRAPAPRPTPGMPKRIFFELALLTAASGLVLYVMTHTITRPLDQLARAADAVGRGAQAPPLPERGSRELRRATRAFNAMQERLRRYLDSRTRVLAAMSHDLRTPLTRLRLRVESIEDETLRQRCTADIEEMTQMVQGALSVFRGMNEDESAVAVDINALVIEVAEQRKELGGMVSVSGRASTKYIGKPMALKRCLGNLLDNAIQHGTRCEIHIEDGTALSISLRDDGPGIPAADLDRVFEPFFRLEGSRNRDTGGTGLGLSIARDIAQAHGGSLTLRNLADGGLEATLQLPR